MFLWVVTSIIASAYFLWNFWQRVKPEPPPILSRAAEDHPWERDLCAQGNAKGCTALGGYYERDEESSDGNAQALAYFKRGCEGGDGSGCSAAAGIYELGRYGRGPYYIKSDVDLRVQFLKKACELGDGIGCSVLAHAYRNGDHAPKDPTLEAEYLRKACEEGVKMDCPLTPLRRLGRRKR